MVQLIRKLLHKPRHRADHNYAKALYLDLYALLHGVAHSKRVISPIRRVAVFSVRRLAPRPAPSLYTKRLENLKIESERINK